MSVNVTPLVSVIVASHRPDRIEVLAESLSSLVRNDASVEAIVVADYATEFFHGKFPAVVWVYLPDRSIPVKRNRGIKEARGEICAFVDDDCVPQDGWPARAITYLQEHPTEVGVEGLTVVEDAVAETSAYREFKRLESRGYRTNNILYRKSALEQCKGFDERFAFQREDVDLAYTLLEMGKSIGYDEKTRVTHAFRPAEKWDLLKNCYNRRYDPLLYRKHRRLYREHVGSPFPASILAVLAAHLLVACSAGISAPVAGGAALADAALVTVLTFRRGGAPWRCGMSQSLRELISFAVAPILLLAALVHGSVRFSQLLLF